MPMLSHLALLLFACAAAAAAASTAPKDASVLILGGGVAGVLAARSLHARGIHSFKIIEARTELGGRMRAFAFGGAVLELGANWIQGTQTGDGPANPMYLLARKHGLATRVSDYYGSMTTYDYTGPVDYLDTFNDAIDAYTNLTVVGGERVPDRLVDATSRTEYSMIGVRPKTAQQLASEYYMFDWEYAQTPEQTSWIASSWANNFTYDPDQGGFSDDNLLSIDQRGFAHLIKAEAAEFLREEQLVLNATVKSVKYSHDGVTVKLVNGTTLSADYAIMTFSLGVLQNDDVKFEPALPSWKVEAIESMTMATYTKIFLQFPKKFWFETQFALYADRERGRYPVWQSLDIAGFFPDSGIIFVTVTGDYSQRIEALPDSQVQEEVLSVLRAMYPNITIPEPEAFHFPRWFSDPLYRGSYSNWPSSFVSDHHKNLRATLQTRLWFTGEAMSQKYFGFLHGAYFEGEATGHSVADCIANSGCPGLPHVEQVRSAAPYVFDRA